MPDYDDYDAMALARAQVAAAFPDPALPRSPHKPGRPTYDAGVKVRVTLYLPGDVLSWLKAEAQERANGWTMSRLVTEVIREVADRA